MNDKRASEKWLFAFAKNIPMNKLKEYVLSDCNFLWHIFSFELVPCLKGEKAKRAFDALTYDKAIMFKSGYFFSGKPEIIDLQMIGKLTSDEIENTDVYITDPDYKWTYVHTHESDCGPYFIKI